MLCFCGAFYTTLSRCVCFDVRLGRPVSFNDLRLRDFSRLASAKNPTNSIYAGLRDSLGVVKANGEGPIVLICFASPLTLELFFCAATI